MFILSLGAIINIGLNYFLIPVIGIEGASIATLMGYIISNVICVIVLIKMKLMIISRKFIISLMVIIIYLLTWRLLFTSKTIIGLLLSIFITVLYMLIYRKDLLNFYNSIKK